MDNERRKKDRTRRRQYGVLLPMVDRIDYFLFDSRISGDRENNLVSSRRTFIGYRWSKKAPFLLENQRFRGVRITRFQKEKSKS